jgi:hypothetical protein
MNVPNRINHRRRIIYTALRSVLDKDQRIPKLFKLWDRKFGQASTFMVATYIDTWMSAGFLKDQEKRDLSRALMQFMSYDYNDLKPYPDAFVTVTSSPKENPEVVIAATPNPENTPSAIEPPPKPEPIKPEPIKTGSQNAKAVADVVKLTQSGVVLPAGYVMFQETMQTILRHLKNSGHSNEAILQSLLGFIKERNLMNLEPLLSTWSKQGFSSEHLPKLKDPKVMQVFMVMFYKVTSDFIAPTKTLEAVKIQGDRS